MLKLNYKNLTACLLLLLIIFNGFYIGYNKIIVQVIVAIFVSLIVDTGIIYYKKKKIIFSWSALITGIIIASVLAPNTSWQLVAVLSLIAIISKHLIKINNRPLFNPAALALLIGALFFKAILGWWVAEYHVLIIIFGSLLLYFLPGRWKLIFSFLVSLIVFLVIRSVVFNLVIIDELYFYVGISCFFMFFMLTDPKTAPVKTIHLVIFGILTALGTIASVVFFPSTVFLGGLLVANLYNGLMGMLESSEVKSL